MLWQLMLSRMRKAGSSVMADLLNILQGMELNGKYPMERFVKMPFVKVDVHKHTLMVRLASGMRPHIKTKDTQYRYELFLLLLGKDANNNEMVSETSNWMESDEAGGEIHFDFTLPPKTAYYLLCLHFMTGKDGKATETLATRRMQIVAVEMV